MSQHKRPTARFEICVSRPNLVESLFRMLSCAPDFAWNLVRGRVTPMNARYELQVSGSAKAIKTMLNHCETHGVKVRAFEMLPQ